MVNQTGELGDGRIDNFIIDPALHLGMGVVVLVALTVATALVAKHAWANEPIARPTMGVLVLAQIVLTVQVLIGIKLLDQGQGIVQLYIHYIGGLAPLGAFLIGGWFARGDTGRGSRILFVLLTLGYVSALMAFFIGRAYANGG